MSKARVSLFFLSLCSLAGFSNSALAGQADVVKGTARQTAPGIWRISATLRHSDEGWDHYADRWEVVGPNGNVLGVRPLAHPHVDEQPFTRSLTGVAIPEEVTAVTIRAHDSVHGLGGETFLLRLDRK